MKLEFSRQVFEKKKKAQTPNIIKNPSTELYHADGQTDMRRVIIAFRSLAKAPNKGAILTTDSHFTVLPYSL